MQPHTREMKPLDGTLVVVAADHLTVGDLLTQAICGLIRIDRQVRGRHLSLGLALWPFLLLWWGFGSLFTGRSQAHVVGVVHPSVALSGFSILLASGAFPTRLVCPRWAGCDLVPLLVMVTGFSRSDVRWCRRHHGRCAGCHGGCCGNVALWNLLRWQEKLRMPVDLTRAVFNQLHLQKEEQMESGGGAQTTRGQRQKECITFHCWYGARFLFTLQCVTTSEPTIWPAIWIFSSPSSWLRIRALWMDNWSFLLWSESDSRR